MTDIIELETNLQKSFHRNVTVKGDDPYLHLLRVEVSKQSIIDDEDYEAARVFETFLTEKRNSLNQNKLINEANRLLSAF
jgi:hypothetical protein